MTPAGMVKDGVARSLEWVSLRTWAVESSKQAKAVVMKSPLLLMGLVMVAA